MQEKRNRVTGILIGLAAGDRIGGPTHMALRLGESLYECGNFNLEDIRNRYFAWWKEGAFDTGPTTARVFELVDSGSSFEEATAQVHFELGGLTAGCNPVHRATPLAMLNTLTDDDLKICAYNEAKITHHNEIAGDISAAAISICRALILGENWTDAIANAKLGRLDVTSNALKMQPFESLNRDGFAPHVLSAAAYFVASSRDFNTMLKRAISFAGPANYCPVLAGSIGGARWGASNIDSAWFANNNVISRIKTVAEFLASSWS